MTRLSADEPVLTLARAKAQTAMKTLDLNLLFSTIAALAILLYMAPGVLRLRPQVRRYTEPAAMAVILLGMLAAVLLWAFGG